MKNSKVGEVIAGMLMEMLVLTALGCVTCNTSMLIIGVLLNAIQRLMIEKDMITKRGVVTHVRNG